MNYLIPLRLLRGQLPSTSLLHHYPRLRDLYAPFISALRAGDVKAYDAALEYAEVRLVDMGVWLAVERAREICMRCLFKKVYVSSLSALSFCHIRSLANANLPHSPLPRWKVLGKPSRIEISNFHDGFRVSGLSMPMVETECLLANMIYKGYIKGYISHEKQTVVLAKGDAAFPKLRDRPM